jgi:hypothetical protein
MKTSQQLTENAIYRAKNLQEFVVEREMFEIPPGVIRYNIQHTSGEAARIFVPALTQEEAERKVDNWFEA